MHSLWKWLFSCCFAAEHPTHQPTLSMSIIRAESAALIDAFESFGRQCFDTDQVESLGELQRLAHFVAAQLAEKVGFYSPPAEKSSKFIPKNGDWHV